MSLNNYLATFMSVHRLELQYDEDYENKKEKTDS